MDNVSENKIKVNSHNFYAGAARVDITPPMGTILGVDYVPHYARFMHDPLYSKALVFKNENLMIAIVVVDICIMPSDLMADIKSLIQTRTGISPENVMLSSTHTHGAADVVGLLAGAVDIAYRTKLPDLIVKSVELATQKLKVAKIATGSVNLPDHLLCRRYLMKEGYVAINQATGETDQVKTNPIGDEHLIEHNAAPTDPGIGFIAVKGTDDIWIALLGNYSSHYAGDWHVDSVTADIYGEFSDQLQIKLNAGKDFVGMLSYGTGADVNHWDFQDKDRVSREQFAKTKLIGGSLSDRVVEGLKDIKWQDSPSLSARYEELELSVRKPSPEELQTATRIVIENDFDDLKIDAESISRIYAREQLLLNDYPDTSISAVQAIRIGNLIIGALGGEFFSETGLLLKKSIADFNYFSVCLANTYGGYIPPAHEMERGGYETWRARSSFLEESAELKIRTKMLELVSKL